MARPTGFEPVTSGFVDQRSIRAELRARSFGSLTTLLKHTPIVDLPGVSIRKVFQGMQRRESTKRIPSMRLNGVKTQSLARGGLLSP